MKSAFSEKSETAVTLFFNDVLVITTLQKNRSTRDIETGS